MTNPEYIPFTGELDATPEYEPFTGKLDGEEKDGAFIRGLKRAKQSATITTKLATGDTAGTAETIRDAEIYNQQNPSSKESDELSKAWEDGDGITGGIAGVGREFAKDWRESKGFVSGLRETGKNVNALREGIVSQLGNSVAPMVGLVAGGAAGAAAGTAVPVVGNIAGGIAGGWAGAAAGNTLVEGGGQLQDALHKANIDPMDTVAVEKFVAENGDKILGQSAIKGGIIGAVDTATAGIAGRLLNVPARAAVNRALVDMGVDVADKIAVKEAMKNSAAEISSRLASDTAYQASRTGAENIARNAGAAALDPAGEFTGEYVGQGAATGDWNTKNAALEALSSVGQSGAMFAGQKGYQALTNPFRNGKTGEAAPQSNTPITDAAQATGAFPQLPAPSITVNADGTAETTEDRNARIAARAAGDIADVTPIPNTPEYQDVRGFAPAARQMQALEAPTITVDGNGQALTAQDRNNRLSDRLSGGVTDVTPIQRTPEVIPPSRAMGLNPANGSLSGAAAMAVDSGASVFGSISQQGALNGQQTQEAQQAGEGQSQGGRASGAAPKTRAVKTRTGEIVLVNESDFTSGAKSLRTFTADGKPRAARLDAANIAPPPPKVVLQNRDRSTSASIQQMNDIVAQPDFLKAGTSSTMDRGAPMVFGDLPSKLIVGRTQQVADDSGKRIPTNYAVVEADDLLASNNADGTTNNEYAEGVPGKLRAVAGNGRVAGLQEAWNRGTTGGYAADLAQEAESLGIDPQALAGFSRPVLVRVMDEADVTADIGDRSNIQSNLQLSVLERAGNDVRRMDLRDMEFNDKGNPTSDTMRQFMAAMPTQERGDMLDKQGLPTLQLIDRIKAAAFKQAYMSDSLVELATQSVNDDAKRILNALTMAAGDMVQLDGTGEFDIRQAVADAAGLAVNAAKKGEKLSDYLRTVQIDESPEAIAVARFFEQNSGSANQIADGLRAWANLAKSQVEAARANADQGSMFGETPTLSRNQLFERLSDENITDIEREQLIAQQERAKSIEQSADAESAERAGDADSAPDSEGSSEEIETESFALDQQTPQELQALEEEQAALQQELEQEQRDAEAADRAKQTRDEVTRRSEAAADSFQLGQSAEDSLSGQGDIFAQQQEATPEAPPKTLKEGLERVRAKKAAEKPAKNDATRLGSGATGVADNALSGKDAGAPYQYFEEKTGLIRDVPSMSNRDGTLNDDGKRLAYTEWSAMSEDERALIHEAIAARKTRSQQADDSVRKEYLRAEKARLEGARIILSSNGNPYKTEGAAAKFIEEKGIEESHYAGKVDGGWAAVRRTPSEMLERENGKKGIEDYTTIQSRVVAEMGLTQAWGEDAITDAQWEKIDNRVDAIQRGQRGLPPVEQATAEAKPAPDKDGNTIVGRRADGVDEGKTKVVASPPDGDKTATVKKTTSPPVTPQIATPPQLKSMIGIAADSIEKLRKQDVERVLSEAPAPFLQSLAAHIRDKRKDLVDEVAEVMQEVNAKTAPTPTETAPKPEAAPAPTAKKTAAKKPDADKTRAKADLMNALADLGDILGKGNKLFIVPEQEQKLLPVLARVLDAAFRLGYHKFKDASKFALDQMRKHLGNEAADALTIDHLQGAYIAMSGGKKGVDTKRAVIDVESKAEIEAHEAAVAEEQDAADNDNKEQAIAAAKSQAQDAKDNALAEAEQAQQEKIARDAAAAKKADTINGFTVGMAPNTAALATKALGKLMRFREKVASVREHIEAWHKAGELEVSTTQEPRIKPMSRMAYHRADQQQQDAHEKRMKEAGNKTVYWVNDIDLGKTAFDYASHLLNEDDQAGTGVETAQQQEAVKNEKPEAERVSNGSSLEAEDVIKKSTGKVENFGEELQGKRKPAKPLFADALDDTDIAKLPLSKIWPADAHEAVEDTARAALMFAARQEIPAKPRQALKLRAWVAKVQGLRVLLSEDGLASLPLDQMLAKMRGVRRTMGRFADRLELLTHIERNQWGRIDSIEVYPHGEHYTGDGFVSSPFGLFVVDGKRDVVLGAKSVADMMGAVNAALGQERQAEKLAFEIRHDRKNGEYFINKKGDKLYRRIVSFPSLQQARTHLENEYADVLAKWNALRDSQSLTDAQTRGDTNAARSGKDWRGGQDATVEMFDKAFGFRGVEFGSWVSQGTNAKERQGFMNQAYDALHDLADIVGVPTRALSLNGTMGLAFGSRGGGKKAAAHYEPSNQVINLTKTKGAGALAHEWFHALDNYFARFRQGGNALTKEDWNQEDYRDANYMTHNPEGVWVNKQNGRSVTPAELPRALKWSGKLDERLSLEENAKQAGWEKRESTPVRKEVETAFAQLIKTLVDSPMAARAKILDSTRQTPYWSRRLEIAARAFENYVTAKMLEQGNTNDFLANIKSFEQFQEDTKTPYPYLTADELTPVRQAFEELFSTIETKAGENDKVVMFSRSNIGQQGAQNGQENGMPRGLSATSTVQSRTLEDKINADLRRLGDAGDGLFRAVSIPQNQLPDALSSALGALRAATGTQVHIFRNLTPQVLDFNGVSFRDGTVHINETSQNPATLTAAHEWLHNLRRTNPDLYRELADEVARQGRLPDYQQRLKRDGETRWKNMDVVEEELTAAAVSDALTDPVFLQRLAERDQSAFRRVAKAFLEFLKTLTAGWKDQGSNAYLQDVEAFRDKLEQVLDKLPVAKQKPGDIQALFLRVWHGTPHRDIEKTGFKLDKIGTGDGAQTYGWGMYFAESELEANLYVEGADGQLYQLDLPVEELELLDWDRPIHEHPDGIKQAILRLFPNDGETYRNDLWERAQEDFYENGPSGYDFDRLQAAFNEAMESDGYGEVFGSGVWDELKEAAPSIAWKSEIRRAADGSMDGLTGGGIYRELVNTYGSARAASEKLLDEGVQGAKFTAGDNATHNYVIWDEALLTPEKAQIEAMYSRGRSQGASVVDDAALQRQFDETARAYGGQDAYAKAKADGKTKLNYGQWVQVRTPNFKAWFGDWENDPANASKVTDPQTGEPMVVYHGGHRLDGNAFKTDNGFGGIFTNPDYEMAGEYAQQYSEKDGVIYPLFINAKNPVHEDDLTGRAQPELIASAKAAGHDAAWLDATTRRNGKAQYPSLVFFNPTQAKLATPDLYVDGTSFWGHEIVATGNNGNFDPENDDISYFGQKSKAKQSGSKVGTPTDRAVMDMVRDGKTAQDVLRLIAGTSRSKFNKQVARLLLKTGAAPSVHIVSDLGSKGGFKHLAKYSRKNHALSMTEAATGRAEQIFLHEMIHAATLMALDRKSLPSVQMRVLFNHVKKQGGAAGQYGMTNVGEFVSEALTNPKFQQALRGMKAPAQSPLHSAWDYLVRTIKSILGLPHDSTDALSAALEIGVAVMRENMARDGGATGGQGFGTAFSRGKTSAVKNKNAPTSDTPDAFAGRPSNGMQERAVRAVSGSPELTQFSEAGGDAHLSTLRAVDVFGNGRRIEYYDDAKGTMYSMQKYPRGERWTAWDVFPEEEGGSQVIGEFDRHHSFADAVKSIRGARISASAKARLAKYSAIPNTWDGYAKKLAKALIDAGVPIDHFANSTQSRSKYIYLDDGRKIRLSDHDLPSAYDAPDYDYRYGVGNIAQLVEQVTTSNNGNFDPENDDISYFGAAGVWQSPEPTKFDQWTYLLQDKQIDTKRVLNAIKSTGQQVDDAQDVYLQETLYHGRTAKRVKGFAEQEERPLMELMRDKGLSLGQVEEYLHARHAPEANKALAERNPSAEVIAANLKAAQAAGDEGEAAKWRNAKPYTGTEEDRLSLSGMSDAEAAAVMAALTPEQRTNLQAAAKMVDAIVAKTRQTFVEYGLETQETVDAWGKAWAHYVPLMREQPEDTGMAGMGTGQGFSVKGKETKGRTGSTKKVVDILANINMQRERAIVRGEKNRVATALLGLVKDNPNKDFWHIAEPGEIPSTQVIDKKTGLVTTQIDPLFKSRDNALIAKVNGVEKVIIFNENDERATRMAVALKNMNAANLEGLLGNVASVTRYLAAVNTQYNPIFGVVNIVRDFQEAAINMQKTPLAGKQKQVLGNAPKAIWQIGMELRAQRKGEKTGSEYGSLWEEFQEQGGQTGYRDMFNNSAERSKQLQNLLKPDAWADTKAGRFFTVNGALKVPLEILRKTALRPMLDLLSDYNEAIENGVRLSAYKAALDIGMSKPRAAELAKNLTVNFNRKGQVAQQVGALYAFFNASVQGTARMGQTIFDMEPGKPKTIRLSSLGKKIVGGGVLLGSVQALLLAASGFGDDEPPEFIRKRNLVIPNPLSEKGYISIPMPLGYHVLTNLGRIPTEYALSGFKGGSKRAISLLDVMSDIYNPIGGSGLSMQTLAPSVLDPFAALAENKDFTGRAIAKQSFNKVTPGHALGRDTSTLLAQGMSKAVNYATGGTEYTRGELSPTPDQIDYLIGQVTGGVGREASKVSQSTQAIATGDELPWHKVPLVGRFYGDADSPSAKQSAYYNLMDDVRRHSAEVKGLRNDGKATEAIEYMAENPQATLHIAANAAERQVKKLRDRMDDLKEQNAPRESIKEVETQMTEVMQRFAALVQSKKKP